MAGRIPAIKDFELRENDLVIVPIVNGCHISYTALPPTKSRASMNDSKTGIGCHSE